MYMRDASIARAAVLTHSDTVSPGRRKRKIFQTPEERKAWEARSEARIRDLQGHIERITAELAAKKRPA